MLHVAYIEPDLDSIRRGGTTRTAACVCGWRGPQRGTIEMAADDAREHEISGSESALRVELRRRIASNEEWLSKNFLSTSKHVRRECEANIERDKRALADLDAGH